MKERLTGAIILVVLIVLLVPELLSGPKGASAPAPAGSAANSSEEPPLRSYTINLGDDSHSRTESAGGNGPSMPQPSGPEQPTAQPSGGTTDGTSTNGSSPNGSPPSGAPTNGAQTQAADPTKPPAPPSGVTSPAHAPTPPQPHAPSQSSARAAPSPRAQPSPHPADLAQPAPKSPTPKPSAPATKPTAPAVKVAAPVAKTTKGHPAAGSSAAANTATSSESGWAVQLGVFASRENAERLALEVRVKGFKASVSPVTSGGRKLYRVRVGPAPDRSAAQELQGRLKAAGRSGGTVVPYS